MRVLLRQCYDNGLNSFWGLASSAGDGGVVGTSATAAPADVARSAAAVANGGSSTGSAIAAAQVVGSKASETAGGL